MSDQIDHLGPFLKELEKELDPRVAITDPDIVRGFATDWTGRYVGETSAVLRPRTASEAAVVVELAGRYAVGLVAQGGNTSLVAGAVPLNGEVILSSALLSQPPRVDRQERVAFAGAGVTLKQLQQAVGREGLAFGVDLAARDSATVGGMVSTNAGGINVLRYGSTRAQMLGVEAVVGGGRILQDLRALKKDNTGYHLPSLMCGAEGTLGFLTKVALRLVPLPDPGPVVFISLRNFDEAVEIAGEILASSSPRALEVMFDTGLRLVSDAFSVRPPEVFEGSCALLCEFEGSLPQGLETLLDRSSLTERVAIAQRGTRQAQALWDLRELHPAAIAHRGIAYKCDLTLPVVRMSEFMGEVEELAKKEHVLPVVFGHMGDGNLHVNLLPYEGVQVGNLERAEGSLFELAISMGGSFSSEHGVGVAKSSWLAKQRSEVEVSLMKGIKAVFDPAGIFNPHAVFDI